MSLITSFHFPQNINTSVINMNSTSGPFHFKNCFNGVYLGIVVMYVTESLCFILGTPALSWLLWVYLRAGLKIKPTHVFPLNMTVLELVYSVQCALEIINVAFFYDETWRRETFYVYGISWAGRPLIQVCICVEQYLAVVHPVMFLKFKALQYRIVCAAVVWLVATACTVFEGFRQKFPHHIFNSVFFISVIIILFCCVSVLRALKHPGPGDTQISVERSRDVGNQQKRKAFNMICTGLLIILITYLPQISLSFIIVIQMETYMYVCNIAPIMASFNVVAVMITPFLKIYKNMAMKCVKHQREIKKHP